jgi:hypothetical protein
MAGDASVLPEAVDLLMRLRLQLKVGEKERRGAEQ